MRNSASEGERPWSLAVVLRKDEAGPALGREAVTEADLIELKAEAWFSGCLRRGHRDRSVADLAMRITPEFVEADRCSGFSLDFLDPAGHPARHLFSMRSLREVAARGARKLVAAGALAPGDVYYFEVNAEQVEPGPDSAKDDGPRLAFTDKDPPLALLTIPIRLLYRQAVRLGPDLEGFCPVFFTQEALAEAERLSRRGGERVPPQETGAILIGPLCSCPETGEAFPVVSHVVSVQEAEEREFALTYSSNSWGRIREALREKQAEPGGQTYRLLGQSHGHNFPPCDGKLTCSECALQPSCTRTSVFVSEADQQWSRAVFSRQPWHLCQIFGLDARGAGASALFGQRDARLKQRPYFLIPHFDPEGLTTSGAPEPERSRQNQ
jgi:hypothetical protein